ncbi:MAG: DUF1508 domain-containing protein [Deltaproteobacteria bacterium]|nr:DUF1508 domain-containing protein [Deltaproteobacteria bacterium]
MTETYAIAKFRELLPAEDHAFLRKTGIELLEKLAAKLWTDYNSHDPGVTILELLCYAITELSYRTSYDIKDILTARSDDPMAPADSFFTAAQILPCSPVTVTDLRKVLVDVRGVKNAWIEIAEASPMPVWINYEESILTFEEAEGDKEVILKGLYTVLLEFEEEVTEHERKGIVHAVEKQIHKSRNLCEDFLPPVRPVEYEEIALCADIEVARDADIEAVLAEIYHGVSQYFSPQINFYTIEELLNKGKTIDEIFEGPLLEHGFIDGSELEKAGLRRELRVSDIINFIMDIEGVVAVKNILLTSYVDGEPAQINQNWILQLSGHDRAPKLEVERSKFIFYKDAMPYIANAGQVDKKLKELSGAGKKYKLKGHEKDIAMPEGEFKYLERFYPVQHDFPLCYGIGISGLPDSATAERKAQSKQLKAYLLFFEQLFADYLAQLAHVKDLFSIDESVSQTYFTQELSSIKGIEALYIDYNDYKNNLYGLVEDKALFEERRNRFLDHLMGRFCENIEEYGQLLYSLMGKSSYEKLIGDKIDFLKDYPCISSERGKAFDYTDADPLWETDNVAGMKKRIYRLLGFGDYERRTFASEHLKIVASDNDPAKYMIKLFDPDDAANVLLTASAEYTYMEYAESMLQYILAYGDNKDHYDLSDESGFKLINHCNDVIAESKAYATVDERNNDFNRVVEYFRQWCDVEGFHIIEHILLRPRNRDYRLLPVAAEKREKKVKAEVAAHRFEVFKDSPKAPGRKFEWRFRLRDPDGNIVLKSEGYKRLDSCIKGIASVRKNVCDADEDFKVLKAKDNTFYFNILADNNEIIGTSNFCVTRTEILEEIDRMKASMPYSDTITSEELTDSSLVRLAEKYGFYTSCTGVEVAHYEEPSCRHGEDPYSFRISVLLPSWSEKFRDLNFRRFVEKTIRMETPAHIFPRICWIDLKQMKELEEAYSNWLSKIRNIYGDELADPEAAENELSAAANGLIAILFNLKNVYPLAKLHDCKEGGSSEDPQIVLDYTSLGIM